VLFIHSCIHSGYFYSASSSSLLLRDAPDSNCFEVNTPKHYRQLWAKYLLKVRTWWLEWDSNLRPSGRKLTTEPPCSTMLLRLFYFAQIILCGPAVGRG